MKRLIVFLIFIFVSIHSYGQINCVDSLSVNLTPPMPTGGYAPGTTVSVCISLTNYSQSGASFLHGVGISFGSGWDTSTIVPVSPIPGCDGTGSWKWFNSCTAFFSGLTFGPGFYYDSESGASSGVIDDIPGNNFGDNCEFYTWNFCLTIQTTAVSAFPIPLTGTVTVTSDGHSGSWGTTGCSIEYHSFTALLGGNPCYASFQLATPPVVQMPLSFVNTSAGVNPTYLWNFGDGITSTSINENHSYASIGTYPVCLVVNTPSCSDTVCANLQIVPNYWQTNYPFFLAGEVFYDVDSNGIRSQYEPGLQGIEMNLPSIGISTFSQASGSYNFPINAGNYSITAPTISNWTLTSDSTSYTIDAGSGSVPNLYFGFKPVQQVTGFELNLDAGPPGCLWPAVQQITLRNTGTIPINGTISYLKHDSVNVIATMPPADSVVQQVYYWSYNNLVPFGIQQVDITVQKPNTAGYLFEHIVYGDIRNTSGQILLSETDTIQEIVLCSFDPNDKQVAPVTSVQGQNYTLLGEDLNYTIRFQNTGNATALNVTIVDTLPAVMDISTFQLITASHLVDVHISPTGVATFNFYGINLPDSASNEPESHGFIKFKLSPSPGLAHLTPVENWVHIFFDQNSPILTNTAQTTYVTNIPVGLPDVGKDILFNLYPNPSNDSFTLDRNLAGLPCTIRLLNTLGTQILARTMDASTNSVIIDISGLPAGAYIVRIEDASGIIVKKVMKL